MVLVRHTGNRGNCHFQLFSEWFWVRIVGTIRAETNTINWYSNIQDCYLVCIQIFIYKVLCLFTNLMKIWYYSNIFVCEVNIPTYMHVLSYEWTCKTCKLASKCPFFRCAFIYFKQVIFDKITSLLLLISTIREFITFFMYMYSKTHLVWTQI